jgi:Pentapeptide repeats (9 copies)
MARPGLAEEGCSDCGGVLAVGQHCAGHLTEEELERYVARLASGEPLEARGATFASGALDRLTKRLDAADVKKLDAVFFGDAIVEEAALLGNFEILGPAIFNGARFGRDAAFNGVTFHEAAHFFNTTFSAGAIFDDATFNDTATFDRARFGEVARFDGAHFHDRASFAGATFEGPAFYRQTSFSKAWLTDAVFGDGVEIGPLYASELLSFDRATFQSQVRLEAAASLLTCRATRFKGSAELVLLATDADLTEASFERRARVSGAAPLVEGDAGNVWLAQVSSGPTTTRLLSLRRAGVQYLSIGNLDLRACRFHNAHGLDELRIEPSCEFAPAPEGARHTRRITLAEEHQMRAERRGSSGPETDSASSWYPPICRAPEEIDAGESTPLEPTEIVGIYRALRKALEDRGDIPGAGDFYYGEMEMRRLSSPAGSGPRTLRGLGEKTIVTLYWLTSGYGLRASRSLALLLLTVLAGGALYHLAGFHEGESLGRSIFFALETAVSLLHPPPLELTSTGEGVEAGLRLLGPLFLGLGLLALRGRVKR